MCCSESGAALCSHPSSAAGAGEFITASSSRCASWPCWRWRHICALTHVWCWGLHSDIVALSCCLPLRSLSSFVPLCVVVLMIYIFSLFSFAASHWETGYFSQHAPVGTLTHRSLSPKINSMDFCMCLCHGTLTALLAFYHHSRWRTEPTTHLRKNNLDSFQGFCFLQLPASLLLLGGVEERFWLRPLWLFLRWTEGVRQQQHKYKTLTATQWHTQAHWSGAAPGDDC